MQATDMEIMKAIRRGDELGMEMLYEKYYPMVVRVAYSMVKSLEDALDIGQEVFLLIVARKKIHTFRGESQLSTWIYSITRNYAMSFMKNRQNKYRHQHVALSDAVENKFLVDHSCCPHKAVEKQELSREVMTVLQKLPNRHHQALYMKYFLNLKYREIAKLLNMSQDRLGMQLMRTKESLTRNRRLQRCYES